MAVHKGSEGTIKVGSNAVAEIVSYSLTENVDLIETTNIADAARAYTTGKTSWGGEIACNWDETVKGFEIQRLGHTITAVFDPNAITEKGVISCFAEPSEAAEFLTYKRGR